MRISDWSSDVCSSDLNGHKVTGLDVVPGAHTDVIDTVADRALVERTMGEHGIDAVIHGGALHKPDIVRYPRQDFVDVNVTGRSEERRAGKACVRTGRSRLSPSH